jgi:protein TonB
MFEQVTTQRKRSPLRLLCFLLGCLFVAGLIGFMTLAPKLWPAEIPPELLARTAPPPPPIMTGNPVPPHVKLVPVGHPKAPRVPAKAKAFVQPPLTQPRQTPSLLPPVEVAEAPGGPGMPNAPGNPNDGPYCPPCVPGPVCPGCIGSDPHFVAPPPPPPKPKAEEPKTPPPAVKQIVVSSGVQAGKLQPSSPKPLYPPLAKAAGVSGVVHLTAVIGEDGTIQNLRVLAGHPLLIQAAVDAVKRWVYQPTLLNGQPVQVVTQIDVNFTLSR